jgi:hypothetical protein
MVGATGGCRLGSIPLVFLFLLFPCLFITSLCRSLCSFIVSALRQLRLAACIEVCFSLLYEKGQNNCHLS